MYPLAHLALSLACHASGVSSDSIDHIEKEVKMDAKPLIAESKTILRDRSDHSNAQVGKVSPGGAELGRTVSTRTARARRRVEGEDSACCCGDFGGGGVIWCARQWC
jgi:hypothetical protein